MFRDIRRHLLNKRLWATAATLSVLGFILAGVYAAKGGKEPFPLSLLYHGNETKQVFFFAGFVFICAFLVPVSRKVSNIMKPALWGLLCVGFALWRWNVAKPGHAPSRVFDVLAHPTLALVGLSVAYLLLISFGFLSIVQAAPVRNTQFGHAFKETWLTRTISALKGRRGGRGSGDYE